MATCTAPRKGGSACSHVRRTHRDVLVILPQLVGSCHHLPFRNPLLQVVHLAVQLEQPVSLVQLAPSLFSQILQARVQLIHFGLAHADTLAGKTESSQSSSSFTNNKSKWKKPNPHREQKPLLLCVIHRRQVCDTHRFDSDTLDPSR